MSSSSWREKLIMLPRYLKEGVKEMWSPPVTVKSLVCGEFLYVLARMVCFCLADSWVLSWVICVRGLVVGGARRVDSWFFIQLLQVRVGRGKRSPLSWRLFW